MKLEDNTIKEKFGYNNSELLIPFIEINIQNRKEARARSNKIGDVFFKLTIRHSTERR